MAGPDEVAKARTSRDLLTHRGPDQWGESIHGNTYLGHRRLSIVDLSERGRQPMLSADESLAITVNGEIYNHQDLRRSLPDVAFRSKSDSEVVLHGYRAWGADGLCQRLDGMYAIVIHDRKANTVTLIRDRAGIKPLYFGQCGSHFLWASELKAIIHFAGQAQLDLDETALLDFLTYRYIPSPKSVYRQIRKLKPAHWATFDTMSGRLTERRYWRLEPTDEPVSQSQAASRLRELMGKSVDEQMMSDVPVGFFLSGGIDSSIVVGEAARNYPGLRTFSIGFDARKHDETHYAEEVARLFSTQQRTRILKAEQSIDLVEWMAGCYDEPFGDTSALPTHQVARLARENVKVVLSGDGGDELFGGYRWYKRFGSLRRWHSVMSRCLPESQALAYRRQPTRLIERVTNQLALLSLEGPLDVYQGLMGGHLPEERRPFKEFWQIPDDYDDLWVFRRYYRPELGELKSLQYLDFHTFLPDDILTKVDRATMAVSLESRVPFLSRSMMEFAFSLPEDFLYLGGQLKGGLKKAYQDLLPATIIERPKKGFSIPLLQWSRPLLGSHSSFQEAVLHHFLSGSRADPFSKWEPVGSQRQSAEEGCLQCPRTR